MTHAPRSILALAALLASASATAVQDQTAVEHAAPTPAPAAIAPLPLGEIGRRLAAAREGDTIEIAPGVYREHLRIDKPVTLVGHGRPVLDGGGSGDIVEILAPNVTFRGFLVRNTGIDLDKENAAIRVLAPRAVIEDNILDDVLFGIDLREAEGSVVRANRIGGKNLDPARRGDGLRLWRSNDARIEHNVLHDGRDAILWYSRGVIVRANTSSDCRYGLHLMYSDDVVIEDNVLTANSVGIYLMYSTGIEIRRNQLIRNRGPSGYGLGLKEADRFTVAHNLFVANRVGVYIDGSPFTKAQPGAFSHNTFAVNDVGVTFLPSARGNQFAENNFIDNIDQVSIAGRGNLTANRFWASTPDGDRGNFWSDYTGYDQNADGIGDFVHEPQTLFENMLDKEPKLRLFLFSPAQHAVEFVARALPAVRPEPKFTDEVPLMTPVEIDRAAGAPRGSLARLGGVGLLLLAVGAGIVSAARPWRPLALARFLPFRAARSGGLA